MEGPGEVRLDDTMRPKYANALGIAITNFFNAYFS
jgi:hypothetical protein